MKTAIVVLAAAAAGCVFLSDPAPDRTSAVDQPPPRVLVFSKTAGFRHGSIGAGVQAVRALGGKHGFEVEATEDANAFHEENLRRFRAVIFLNTTGDVLDRSQQVDFERYIQAGGGYVGVHSATDTEYQWPWYGKLAGAYFAGHGAIQDAAVRKARPFGDAKVPDPWVRRDEWYNFKSMSEGLTVIFKLDTATFNGSAHAGDHPIAWYHDFDGGRAFYTGMGHTDETFSEPLFLDHLMDGIRYAMGQGRLDYRKAGTLRVPQEARFTKTVLEDNLHEPMEMTMLPDGRILFVERSGGVKLYDPKTGEVTLVDTLKVWTSPNNEDGLLSVAADPGFARNSWLYFFYAHPEKSANVLVRMIFQDGKLDIASAKEMLEVPTDRAACCHTGGSMRFDKQGNLYISTGDNTIPFESDGFSPSDDRAGRQPFDAQRSSANTNDLRGKILRIRPQPDGRYTIPEGNLFAPGTDGTRPEIYVMGTRNPYRISLDEKTGALYWGDVGPDAGNDHPQRGPRGYDEINRATGAGNFGWPHFAGDNFAYGRYDFADRSMAGKWDPVAPVNTSSNNTGLEQLPPAQPALIWYPYAPSERFPALKTGGRSSMAGPVYYSDRYRNSPAAFPEYFDDKLLIYDFMRNWIFLVTLDAEGAVKDFEPFMPGTSFSNPMDMEYGPDGRLYVLEYGKAWKQRNLDARLVRIDYDDSPWQELVARKQAAREAQADAGRRAAAAQRPLAVAHPGQALIDGSDCKACHTADKKIVGPTYREIATKYHGQTGAADLLAGKILKGGAGVWGQVPMAAHPQISPRDAKVMAEYILSLGTDAGAGAASAATLVHRYTFNKDTAEDGVGEADGKLIGGVTISGGQARFTGAAGQRVELPAKGAEGVNINTFKALTLEAWYTAKKSQTWQRLFDFGASSGIDEPGTYGSNALYYIVTSGLSDTRAVLSNVSPSYTSEAAAAAATAPLNKEVHVAVVVDGSTLILYLDGAQAAQASLEDRSLADLSNDHAVLGDSMYGNDPSFAGAIDEFRIYKGAATAEQIAASFAVGPDR